MKIYSTSMLAHVYITNTHTHSHHLVRLFSRESFRTMCLQRIFPHHVSPENLSAPCVSPENLSAPCVSSLQRIFPHHVCVHIQVCAYKTTGSLQNTSCVYYTFTNLYLLTNTQCDCDLFLRYSSPVSSPLSVIVQV